MSDISKIKVSGVEYGIKDIQAREDLGNLGNRVTEKVDKVTGKGLSTNDYTDAAKAKVDALAPVATSGSYNDLTNKPTIPSVPKPLTYDYMPEGYPKKTMQTVTLMEEQELAFALAGNTVYIAVLTDALDIAEGQAYTVNWDGTEHKCVCGAINATLYIGNPAIMGMGDDTGEPFIYGYNKNISSGQFATFDTSASHTISVKRTKEIVTPMAEEFLPANTKNTTVFYT